MKITLPGKIVFGTGSFNQLGQLSVALGEHALICTGKSSLRQSGHLDLATQLLRARGIRAECFEDIGNDPDIHTCERAIAVARGTGCDFVVAIGGGSVLDAGKTAAALVPQSGRLTDYFHGRRKFENALLPCVAVPTTAGTGSECTNNAVLTDPEKRLKKSLRDERMIPTIALVDPELTRTCPPDLTARSGMDALTQAIECYVTRHANAFTDALALRAIDLLSRRLPHAVENGADLASREPVAMGSLLTAMAFGNAGLGAVHGLAHPLGAQFHIPHGLVCAVLLPHVCAFNMPVCRDKFALVAPILNARSPEELPAALAELNCRLGLPADLKSFVIRSRHIPAILADCRSGSMANNPRAASDEDLTEILQNVI